MSVSLQKRPPWLSFAVAIAIFAAAVALRLALQDLIGVRIPYVTFFPAVMCAALFGGLYAGIMVTLLSACYTFYFLIDPIGHPLVRDAGDWLGQVIFLASGVMVSWLSEHTRRSQKRALEAEALVKLAAERDQANAALQESEIKFRSYVENSPIAVFVVSREGKYLDFNPAAAELLGYPAQTLARMHLLEVHRIEDHAAVLSKLERLFDTGRLDAETCLIRGDGLPVWVSLHAVRLDGDHAIAYCQDITELRGTVESMRERLALQEQLATITAVVPGVLHSFRRRPDGSFCLSYASPKLQSLCGLIPNNVSRDLTSPLAMVHAEDRVRVEESLCQSARDMTPWRSEFRVCHPGKGEIWVEAHSIPNHEDDGSVLWRGFMHDITEKRTLENQLLQSQKMEAIGRLAGGVAHDFNNNLSVILGYAELARLVEVDTVKFHEYLDEIVRAAEHSRDVTQQLLAFSRSEIISPRELNLSQLIRRSEKTLWHLIGEEVHLTLNTPAELWPVLIDPAQVNQIMMNLALNARDAMPGGGTLFIETANVPAEQIAPLANPEAAPGDYVRMTVSDTGVGMDRELQERIFEPFFTTKGVGKGTGLGLATVYGIMKQNGGFITLSSAPGQGAAFNLYFPRMRPEQAPSQPQVQKPGGSRRVLLVEDEATVRLMAQLMLEKVGYAVLVAASPHEALEKCHRYDGEIDCLLTDVIMPGMSGVELSIAIRAICPQIGVVYMSGYSSDMIAHHGVLEDGVIFLQKPFDVKTLTEKIEQAMQFSRTP